MKSLIYLAGLSLALGTSTVALGDSAALFFAYQYGADSESGVGPGLQYTWEVDPAFRTSFRTGYLQYTELDLDVIPLVLAAAVNFGEEEYVPYAGAGVGYYLLDADRGEIDDNIGFKLYAGVDWPASDTLTWFAEVSWLWLEADVNQEFADTEGTKRTIDLDGAGLNVGLRYQF